MTVRFNNGDMFANSGQSFVGGLIPHPLHIAGALPLRGNRFSFVRGKGHSGIKAARNLSKMPIEGSGDNTSR